MCARSKFYFQCVNKKKHHGDISALNFCHMRKIHSDHALFCFSKDNTCANFLISPNAPKEVPIKTTKLYLKNLPNNNNCLNF